MPDHLLDLELAIDDFYGEEDNDEAVVDIAYELLRNMIRIYEILDETA